jgi:hypothetical protein
MSAFLLALLAAAAAAAPLADEFAREVDRRLEPPPAEQAYYAALLDKALPEAGAPQYFVLVDRSPRVQAALVFWRSPQGRLELVGAAPVSTGKPGAYEHFATPAGAFAHTLANPDFRAEGTPNADGIRGYGEKGMRVFDFGWVRAERGWGEGGYSDMRLQMHATDAQRLEPLLGRAAASKGCIRIPATLNVFIDRHGILDADYYHAGARHWVLRADRQPTPTPGRWLVVVDTARTERPRWAR